MVDAVSVLGTHFAELVRKHAHELFTRQDAKSFCDRVAVENPKVVEDLVPKLLSLGIVQRVLQNLLRERVSVRDGVTILEALAEAAEVTKNPLLLTEFARQAMRRAVIRPFLSPQNEFPAYFLDPQIEQAVESAVEHGEQNSVLTMKPQPLREAVSRIQRKLDKTASAAVAITTSGARHFLRQILEPVLPNLTILSHNEIPPEVKVLPLGTLE